jgi:RimK family alpha-L-glutamate ligase
LAAVGLPVPGTIAGSDPEQLAAAAGRHLGFPVVVKQRRSRMGVGVIRCDRRDQLDAVLDTLWRLGDEVVVQRYVPSAETTVRLVVVGGRVVAAASFTAGPDEWRSNAARGGAVADRPPDRREEALAIAAAAAVGLGHCGVDLVPGDAPIVLEVNPTPGFRHIEEATGVDVARAIVAHVVEVASS